MALYVPCGTALCFAALAAIAEGMSSKDVSASLGVLLVFGETAVLGFVFLGLTQETSAREAMPWKRAILYAAAAGVFLFGLITSLMTYYAEETGLYHAIASLIPFCLPGLALALVMCRPKPDADYWFAKIQFT
jgi:drug/metabolite transporter (DMT)-like permease